MNRYHREPSFEGHSKNSEISAPCCGWKLNWLEFKELLSVSMLVAIYFHGLELNVPSSLLYLLAIQVLLHLSYIVRQSLILELSKNIGNVAIYGSFCYIDYLAMTNSLYEDVGTFQWYIVLTAQLVFVLFNALQIYKFVAQWIPIL